MACETGYCSVWGGEKITTQPKGSPVRLTFWNHRWRTNRLPYLVALTERGILCLLEKLVVKAGVHLMVGRVRQFERQSTKESRRSQLGGVVFVAHEYQATAVS